MKISEFVILGIGGLAVIGILIFAGTSRSFDKAVPLPPADPVEMARIAEGHERTVERTYAGIAEHKQIVEAFAGDGPVEIVEVGDEFTDIVVRNDQGETLTVAGELTKIEPGQRWTIKPGAEWVYLAERLD